MQAIRAQLMRLRSCLDCTEAMKQSQMFNQKPSVPVDSVPADLRQVSEAMGMVCYGKSPWACVLAGVCIACGKDVSNGETRATKGWERYMMSALCGDCDPKAGARPFIKGG